MSEAPDPTGLRAYVISLRSEQARRSAARERLEGLVPYVIVDAVDGRAMSDADLQAVTRHMHSRRLGRPLTPGEVGCSLSHQRALRLFIDSGEAHALILEDDFENKPWTPSGLADLLETARGRPEVEIVKLGGYEAFTARGRLVARRPSCALVETMTFGMCTHAYLVSRGGAVKLAAAIVPVLDPYDHFLRNDFTYGCRVFDTSPWLFGTDPRLTAGSALHDDRAAVNRVPLSLTQRVRQRWERLVYSLRKSLWNKRRFGWRAVFAKSSFQRFPTGET
jgi:glycosyl transferase family 25